MKVKRGKWNLKRALSMFLACAMLFSNVELQTFAAEADAGAAAAVFGSGENTGSENADVQQGKAEEADESNPSEDPAVEDGGKAPEQPGASDGEGEPDVPEADKEDQPADTGDKEDQPTDTGDKEERPTDTENKEDQPADTEEEEDQPEDQENGEEDSPDGENGEGIDEEQTPTEEENEGIRKKNVQVLSDTKSVKESNLQVDYHTQEEIRDFLVQSGAAKNDPVTYASEPVTSAPYSAGALSDKTQQSAITMLNQIRYIAGLSYDVTLDESYAAMSQAASLVNYVNGKLSHTPEQPADMEAELYQQGLNGAGKSNIAWASWATKPINETLVDSWMADDDDGNIPMLGHRRWIINPSMGKTGFGAVKGSKGIYSAVYAFDRSGGSKDVFGVAWPAQNMPTDYFDAAFPWSVSLGVEVTASEIKVKLTRISDGKEWNFASDSADGYFNVNNGGYGETGCIIFRPSDIASYNAGDVYEVEITKNGEAYVNYSVDFFEVSVESENPEEPANPKAVSLSGITVEDKEYDREAAAYTGTPVLKDAAGNVVSGVSVEASYTGTLADGSVYEKSAAAPSQAGSYTLEFEITGADAEQYTLQDASYGFQISRRKAVITAESVEISLDGQLPELSGLQYTVDGLLEGDELVKEPLMRYSEDTISTAESGTYGIIAYDADAGNNYSVEYMDGTLTIGEAYDQEEILDSGTVNRISWKIDKKGKLTIEGTGDYTNANAYTLPPWVSRKEDIVSADVRVTGITITDYMFKDCSKLEKVDLSGLETKNVTSMYGMFDGCSSLTSLDVSTFNTARVEDMTAMFRNCSGLTSLDLSHFDTGNVKMVSWPGGAVNQSQGMFAGCSSLVSLDVSSFDTGNMECMRCMFAQCNNLKDLDVSHFDTRNATDMSGMFFDCQSLESLDVSGFDTSKVTNMGYMFAQCESLKNLDVSHFDTREVTGMSYMFSLCWALNGLDVSGFDTSKVTRQGMDRMFQQCKSLKNLDVSNFDTVGITNMNGMFTDCQSLESLDLSGFDTSNVTSMSSMFARCGSLENLDVSSFDTSNVTDVEEMFLGCDSLVSLDLGSFNLGKAQGISYAGAASNPVNLFGSGDFGSLSYIRAPRNCSSEIQLPAGSWYQNTEQGWQIVSSLPAGLGESIELYKNGYPGDGTTATKQVVYVSGIDVKNKVYDGKADAYAGMAAVTSSSGETVSGIALTVNYTGTLADGSPYEKTAESPSQAGAYMLSAELTGESAEQYVLQKSVYNFRINQKEVTITAPQRKIELGEQLPDLSAIEDYGIEGLLEGDELLTKPLFTYSAENIPTDIPEEYEIIPYGADAGNNYKMKYVRAVLTVGGVSSVDLKDAEISISDIVYDGMAHQPDPVVRYKGKLLRRGEDYEVIYDGADIINVGRYEVYVCGIGFYCGNRTVEFRVIKEGGDPDPELGEVLPGDIPLDGVIPQGLWIAGISEDGYEYTGKAIKPAVRVYDYKTLLKEKTDYTISYTKNINVNAASAADTLSGNTLAGSAVPTITVTGRGNYSGKAVKYFDIRPMSIDPCEGGFQIDDMVVAYTGKAQKPLPVLWGNMNLKPKKGRDYTVAYYGYDDEGNLNEQPIDSVKEIGKYRVEVIGKGNFTGTNLCSLTVTDAKLMSKVSVAKIPNQPYRNGEEITPAVTVKDGKTTLQKDIDYTVEYWYNTEVGTAYAVITGIEKEKKEDNKEDEKSYYGTKRVSFKITGTPIKSASVVGLTGKSFMYCGTDIEPEVRLVVKEMADGTQIEKNLEPNKDYLVTWSKNQNAGTATAVFTGIGGYTGTLKKTFKINKFDIAVNADGRFDAAFALNETAYAKGGVKLKPTVTFRNADGSVQTLTEGKDYTLSYKRHTMLTGGDIDGPLSSVTVKGKGNFSGTYGQTLEYVILPQDIGSLTLTAQDKVYQNKKNIYATKVTVTDLNGVNLKAGTDYDKTFAYTYKEETIVNSASSGETVVREPGESVNKEDIIPVGTTLQVQVNAKAGGNYRGTITGEYRITKASIASASVAIQRQTYTGQAVVLDKSQITVKIKGQPLADSDYEIVPDSYKNNVRKGTARVTIRGTGDYGGIKTVKFTIGAKGFLWWKP